MEHVHKLSSAGTGAVSEILLVELEKSCLKNSGDHCRFISWLVDGNVNGMYTFIHSQ